VTAELEELVLDASDYVPNPTQVRFHRSRARVKAFLAGYRGGKTRAGAEECVVLAAENAGLDGMIVAPTWGTLHKVTLRAFWDPEARTGALHPDLIADHNVGKRYIELVNGSRIYYGSADRPGTLEGTTLAWWWLDEGRLARREAWRILVARLSDPRARRMQGIVTSTPSPGWLYEEFSTRKDDRDGTGELAREVFHGSTRENAAHLPPGYVEDLERTYSAREARVLIEGEFGLLVGAVLEEFERKTHLVEWKYDARFRTVEVWDFGYRRPYVGWAQLVPGGVQIPGKGPAPFGGAWIIFDELVDENLSTEILAGRAKSKGYRVDTLYCDPAGDGTQSATGLGDVNVLKAFRCAGDVPRVRWTTEPRLRHIPNGIAILRGMLRNARGEIRMYVAKALDDPRKKRGVVKDFEGYAYPEAKEGRPVGDMPHKDGLHDHGCDAWRYFGVNEHLAAGGPAVQSTQAR
jgi:hypothetical protein